MKTNNKQIKRTSTQSVAQHDVIKTDGFGFYKVSKSVFLPMKAEPAWTADKDLQEFEARFGKSNNPLRDTQVRLEQNIADLHSVLVTGINYFVQKRGSPNLAPIPAMTLREKVELFAELLPNSVNANYVLRFTTTLAQILWLESEQSRVFAQRDNQPWLFPLYHLADGFASAAFDLEESLTVEHEDFNAERQ